MDAHRLDFAGPEKARASHSEASCASRWSCPQVAFITCT